MKYSAFFQKITGNPPFPYQARLAEGAWPTLLDVPTGLGKTAAAIASWMYRVLVGDSTVGKRLVYCLPMRVLVEQTRDSAQAWCEAAAPLFEAANQPVPTVHVLMGGDVDVEWELCPEKPAILIGTQDLLLSRALNRGYAMSRYKWPVHFALLNNDCSWVFDETQLVGVGIETSAQLAAFRARLGTHGGSQTLWMSATLAGDQLNTVDHEKPDAGWSRQSLTADDTVHAIVQKRIKARKSIGRLEDIALSKSTDGRDYGRGLADRVLREHGDRGGLTLVIVNRVARAQQLYQQLVQAEGRNAENTALIHSRFRATDRAREEAILQADGERIVVATQAVEAGVDVSANTMFSELAPWPSLVQRFGRCNRYGEGEGRIFWVDIDASDSKGLELPYAVEELEQAKALLARLNESTGDAGPESLREIEFAPPQAVRPVIRRRDLLDLFDTTPDLCGNDIDVSRYVRDGVDNDVQFYWREFEDEPKPDLKRPNRNELCRVSIAAARDFLKKSLPRLQKKFENKKASKGGHAKAWRWDPLDKRWESVTQVYPGQVLLLHPLAGGYDVALGWTGESSGKTAVPVVEPGETGSFENDAMGSDPDTVVDRWVLLKDHLRHVRDEARGLAQALQLEKDEQDLLATAGLWHDVGKAHEAFQHKLLEPVKNDPERAPTIEGIWAKSAHRLKSDDQRKHFRHELASALAWLAAAGDMDTRDRDLIAYLIAAHHGKVRLSIRSVPGEIAPPDEPERLVARGVWDGDTLPSFELPDGRTFDGLKLDLSIMQLGENSWLERTLALRDADNLGPFRLAMLETMVRIADWRASKKEQQGAYDD